MVTSRKYFRSPVFPVLPLPALHKFAEGLAAGMLPAAKTCLFPGAKYVSSFPFSQGANSAQLLLQEVCGAALPPPERLLSTTQRRQSWVSGIRRINWWFGVTGVRANQRANADRGFSCGLPLSLSIYPQLQSPLHGSFSSRRQCLTSSSLDSCICGNFCAASIFVRN
jgi:hypothetical protein